MGFILALFDKFGLFMVFMLVMLEYACFPIPSEIILPFMGYVAKMNCYDLFGVIIMSVLMGCLGSLICYLIGYYGGSKIFNKIYNRFPSWQKGLDNSYKFFNKYGNLSVMVGRVIPMCRTYVSFFAGVFKQSLFKYFLYSIIGVVVWNTMLIVLGYYLTSNWLVVSKYYNDYKFFLIGGIIVFIVAFFVYKKVKKTKTINGD